MASVTSRKASIRRWRATVAAFAEKTRAMTVGSSSTVARVRTVTPSVPVSRPVPSLMRIGRRPKKVYGSEFCTIAVTPSTERPCTSTRTCGWAHEVAAAEGRDGGVGVVVLAQAGLQPRPAVDARDHARVQPDPGREDEVALARPAQVHPPRVEVVGQPEQVLGGVHDVVGDSERAAPDVGGAARQAGERRVGAHQPVGGLVHGSVAAEGHHGVVALGGRLAADLGGVLAPLGVHGLDLVAGLERVHHEVPEPVGHRGRVRVHDHEHALLGRARGQQLGRGPLAARGGGLGRHVAGYPGPSRALRRQAPPVRPARPPRPEPDCSDTRP